MQQQILVNLGYAPGTPKEDYWWYDGSTAVPGNFNGVLDALADATDTTTAKTPDGDTGARDAQLNTLETAFDANAAADAADPGATDAACSTIDRQIRKNKTRLSKRLRQDALAPSVPAEFDVSEETEFQVVRTKHVAVKPMSEDEAILQMNLLGHDVFVYRNTDGVVSIVYRRRDGGYGLLETDGVEE